MRARWTRVSSTCTLSNVCESIFFSLPFLRKETEDMEIDSSRWILFGK